MEMISTLRWNKAVVDKKLRENPQAMDSDKRTNSLIETYRHTTFGMEKMKRQENAPQQPHDGWRRGYKTCNSSIG